jgi:hypothetical protein
MAVVTPKSVAITNADAATQTLNPTLIHGGRVKSSVAIMAVANGDSIASIYRMVRVPSNARLRDLQLSCTAITGAIGDIGLYDTAANGSAVVDVDFYASAQSMAAALTGLNVLREATAAGADVAKQEMPIWQALGLTADPKKQYDIATTLTAAATAAGTFSLDVSYVDGN